MQPYTLFTADCRVFVFFRYGNHYFVILRICRALRGSYPKNTNYALDHRENLRIFILSDLALEAATF